MDIFIKLNAKALKEGLITQVGGVKHFAILAAIASFANDKGEAYPSQDKIAEIVGYSRKTVNETIKELQQITIDGEAILRVVQETTASGRRNKYVISSKAGFWFGKVTRVVTNFEGVVTNEGRDIVTSTLQEEEPYLKNNQKYKNNQEEEIIFKSSKDVLQYFRNKYFEKYNVAYQPNWGRDQAMIKNKLMKTYTDAQIKSIIDIVFDEYEKRWAKPSFPRPTIGQLCSWIPNEAMAILSEKEKEAERIERISKKYRMDDDYYERLMKEI